MNFRVAQEQLASQLTTVSSKVNCYFWRLSGDEPNRLCRLLLGMEEEELKVVLCLCKVYVGEPDNISKNNFELVMGLCGCDFTTYRINSRVERFILLVGKEGNVVLPKDMYDEEGNLLYYPVDDERVKIIRTKSQRGPPLPTLVDVGNKIASNQPGPTKGETDRKQEGADIHPKVGLLTYIEGLVSKAAKNGESVITKRAKRQLQRLTATCVDVAAKDLLTAALEKFAARSDPYQYLIDEKSLVSPEKVMSSTTVRVSPEALVSPGVSSLPAEVRATENETIIVDSDDDVDDDSSPR
jgi:hypothetical protein